MSDFNNIEQINGAEIIEEHQFPLYELTGLFQRLRVAEKGITVESIVVNLAEAKGKSDEEILNLVAASGYVKEDSDITFRSSTGHGYFYTYFNFVESTEHSD
ncbi:hypothetical protein KRX19_00775 [Cardiobacteriaceae bacterium TAE3-ERU3]|nr:hypothetical protein [Cardiobacteriaceae bacterium TAE3-ERU3]